MSKPADLRMWLDERKMTLPDFASTIGVTVKGVRLWMTGKSFPRDTQCDTLFTVTKLDCFGPGRDAARAEHERLIPADVKRERREKYNANPELYRGRALKSWRKRFDARAQFVEAAELETLRADPRKRKNVCRECGEILLDAGPHIGPAHGIDVAIYKEKYGFNRSRNAVRSEETQKRQSTVMKRKGVEPPKETHALLPLAHRASLETNKPGTARLEKRLNARRSLAARPKHWKRTAAGDLVRDARIASLRLRDGLSADEIAKRVGLSLAPVFFRLKRMHLPRRARIFLHGESITTRHLRVMCSDFDLTKEQAAERLGVTIDWARDLFQETKERPLSYDLGRAFLKVRRELMRTPPASGARGGRPRKLPTSEREQLPAKYESLLADLQAVRRWIGAQQTRRLSLTAFWDWICREFRAAHFRALHLWPAFFDWIERSYESSAFLSGDWKPHDLAREFISNDYGVSVDTLARIISQQPS